PPGRAPRGASPAPLAWGDHQTARAPAADPPPTPPPAEGGRGGDPGAARQQPAEVGMRLQLGPRPRGAALELAGGPRRTSCTWPATRPTTSRVWLHNQPAPCSTDEPTPPAMRVARGHHDRLRAPVVPIPARDVREQRYSWRGRVSSEASRPSWPSHSELDMCLQDVGMSEEERQRVATFVRAQAAE